MSKGLTANAGFLNEPQQSSLLGSRRSGAFCSRIVCRHCDTGSHGLVCP